MPQAHSASPSLSSLGWAVTPPSPSVHICGVGMGEGAVCEVHGRRWHVLDGQLRFAPCPPRLPAVGSPTVSSGPGSAPEFQARFSLFPRVSSQRRLTRLRHLSKVSPLSPEGQGSGTRCLSWAEASSSALLEVSQSIFQCPPGDHTHRLLHDVPEDSPKPLLVFPPALQCCIVAVYFPPGSFCTWSALHACPPLQLPSLALGCAHSLGSSS